MIVVNYASNNDWYYRGQKRLLDEMINHGYRGKFGLWCSTLPKGSPTHSDNPYAFKVYAIQEGIDAGHNLVWWMDSSVYPVKKVTPVIDKCLEQGYVFEEAGHLAGNWTNDATLAYFGISRDEAMNIPMFSAGFTMLDFNHAISKEFFNQWKRSCELGYFKGRWTNIDKSQSADERCYGHRHDMSCASIIAYKLGMKLESGGDYLAYVGDGHETNSRAIFNLKPC